MTGAVGTVRYVAPGHRLSSTLIEWWLESAAHVGAHCERHSAGAEVGRSISGLLLCEERWALQCLSVTSLPEGRNAAH